MPVTLINWLFENGDITNKGTFILELVLSLIISVLLWHFTKPDLQITINDDKIGEGTKYLHVKVTNKGRILFITRETALETSGEVYFTEIDKEIKSESFFPKWASKPNPIIPVIFPTNVSINGRPAIRSGFQFDETKVAESRIEDIFCGSSKLLDVAVKFSGESEFYAMTPENFMDAKFRPSKCKFSGLKYLVTIKVKSENGTCCEKKLFLENQNDTLDGFFLKTYESPN